MSIKVACNKCGQELTEPGGLAFSPPLGGEVTITVNNIVSRTTIMKVDKKHLCVSCWERFEQWLISK